MSPSLKSSPNAERSDQELLEVNRQFYDSLWTDARLVEPQRFNTWSLVSSLLASGQSRLEVAPGLRPRFPLEGTQFVDLSAPAIAKLKARGASAAMGLISALPFPDGSFDLACAFDIVEHVDDDEAALSELARVCRPGAALLLAVPLHASSWTAFDEFVGHRRRYEPTDLLRKLSKYGFAVEQSAIYGMQPESSRLLDLGVWFLTHRRATAMRWYNRLFVPLSVRFQKSFSLGAGMIDTNKVDEVLLVCRRA
ncbi:MAG: class I SAM-dependent methyltransferase [Deltaproteobacteria bacterium]|nr:class I SAM-dependent methyltransferase [Deltaproteobacteria bacterium]